MPETGCLRTSVAMTDPLRPEVLAMRKFAFCLFFALLAITGAAFAGGPTYTFVVIPAAPTAGQPIQIQVSVGPLACNALPTVLRVATLPGNVIRFDLWGSDACLPDLPAQQRTYDIGSFPAGQYVFRLADCGGNFCVTRSEQTVVIGGAGSGATQPVPVLTHIGVAILALCLLALAATTSKLR